MGEELIEDIINYHNEISCTVSEMQKVMQMGLYIAGVFIALMLVIIFTIAIERSD